MKKTEIIKLQFIWSADNLGKLLKAIAESLEKVKQRMQIDLTIALVEDEKTS